MGRLSRAAVLLPFLVAVSLSHLAGQTKRANGISIKGKVFAITQGGDLKPARMARVYVVNVFRYERFTAMTLAMAEKNLQRVQTRQNLLNCSEKQAGWELGIAEMIKEAQENPRAKVWSAETDENGEFQISGVLPGSYYLLAYGQAGINHGYWAKEINISRGVNTPFKLTQFESSCSEL